MQAPNNPSVDPSFPPPASSGRFRWPWFAATLLIPPLLTTLAASLDHRGAAAPALGFLGSAAGGLACGIPLGCRVGKTGATKVVLAIVFSGLAAISIITLSFCGCMIGNYKLDFR